MHPEGMCVRRKDGKIEIAYIELKNVKNFNKVNEIKENVLRKMEQGLPIRGGRVGVIVLENIIVDEIIKQFLINLKSTLCSPSPIVSFYLVISNEAFSLFESNLLPTLKLAKALNGIDAIFLCRCNSGISNCKIIFNRAG